MENFCQILPLDSSGSKICGYINVMNEEFYIDLHYKVSPNLKKVRFRGCKKLQKVLDPVLPILEKHLLCCETVEATLSEIQHVLEQQIIAKESSNKSQLCTDYHVLCEQIQECGWEKVHYISSNFGALHLKAIDEQEREHILKIWIPEKFPNEQPKYECDLPQEFSYKWLLNDTLANIFMAFQERLNAFTIFWNNMDEIDEKTWVLEPEKPNRKDCKRKIAIASGVSLVLVVNPSSPTSIPTCHYLGPEKAVEPVREKFNKNIHLWSEYDSIYSNLKQILEIEFPTPTANDKEEFCLECGICYSYLLGDAVPEMICESQNCNQTFHHACLYEYIRMLPDVRTSFNKLFGQCPYCSMPLWCTIP